MKLVHNILFSSLLLIFFASQNVWAWDANAEVKANETLAHFANKDKSMDNFFKQAYGYAVFPTIGKAGFVVGGAHGEGVVYKQGVITGTTKMTQVSVGWQAGAEAYSEIIFFEKESDYEAFIKGSYALGAQASAVAVKSGIATQTNYNDGVAIFTDYKGGLMAAASVGGQKFTYKAK
ncbi:MAG: lipid-binding SYLF domain-containing protein [Gammaproteobacteria bacterium]|nr:lipid-binding SYLF domain-containing protein [Gammaproteobacteria bacterium]